MEYSLTTHAEDMLRERNITEEWVKRTLDAFDWKHEGADAMAHYYKSIPEREDRILHVVLNPLTSPRRVVTVFFDRRARRQLEIENGQE